MPSMPRYSRIDEITRNSDNFKIAIDQALAVIRDTKLNRSVAPRKSLEIAEQRLEEAKMWYSDCCLKLTNSI